MSAMAKTKSVRSWTNEAEERATREAEREQLAKDTQNKQQWRGRRLLWREGLRYLFPIVSLLERNWDGSWSLHLPFNHDWGEGREVRPQAFGK
jgi:hypothetical protein